MCWDESIYLSFSARKLDLVKILQPFPNSEYAAFMLQYFRALSVDQFDLLQFVYAQKYV